MSEPRALYTVNLSNPMAPTDMALAFMLQEGVLVPATVDDLLAALPKCEHGKIEAHAARKYEWNGRSFYPDNGICPGGAALGSGDDE